ncbi:MAG: hypothetical protein ACYC67_04180 [Prosthecobacter sp.]
MRLLAWALLKPVVEQDFTFPQLHEAWATINLETRKEMIHQALQLLEAGHPMVSRSVLRDDKAYLAAQWLSRAACLTENELKYLGVPEPLTHSEMAVVIQLFGKLASHSGSPAVLILDQLDLVTTQPQFDEMQRRLFALIDQSENWVVLTGLVVEHFAVWDASLTQALRGVWAFRIRMAWRKNGRTAPSGRGSCKGANSCIQRHRPWRTHARSY